MHAFTFPELCSWLVSQPTLNKEPPPTVLLSTFPAARSWSKTVEVGSLVESSYFVHASLFLTEGNFQKPHLGKRLPAPNTNLLLQPGLSSSSAALPCATRARKMHILCLRPDSACSPKHHSLFSNFRT